jgi:hypothetical protein
MVERVEILGRENPGDGDLENAVLPVERQPQHSANSNAARTRSWRQAVSIVAKANRAGMTRKCLQQHDHKAFRPRKARHPDVAIYKGKAARRGVVRAAICFR